VDDGRTGLLFEPGSAPELARKVRYLWDHPGACRRMGHCGRTKSMREYSADAYYHRLMNLYDKALRLGPGGPARPGMCLA
jgi:glycosyltransferase involved in cell wall biosynthesis